MTIVEMVCFNSLVEKGSLLLLSLSCLGLYRISCCIFNVDAVWS